MLRCHHLWKPFIHTAGGGKITIIIKMWSLRRDLIISFTFFQPENYNNATWPDTPLTVHGKFTVNIGSWEWQSKKLFNQETPVGGIRGVWGEGGGYKAKESSRREKLIYNVYIWGNKGLWVKRRLYRLQVTLNVLPERNKCMCFFIHFFLVIIFVLRTRKRKRDGVNFIEKEWCNTLRHL